MLDSFVYAGKNEKVSEVLVNERQKIKFFNQYFTLFCVEG